MFGRNKEEHEGRLNGESKGSWNYSEDEYQGTLNGEKKKVIVTTTDAVENLKETCSDVVNEVRSDLEQKSKTSLGCGGFLIIFFAVLAALFFTWLENVVFVPQNYANDVGVVVDKYYEERSENERYDKFVIVVEREVVQENGEITTVQEEHQLPYKHYEQMVIGTVVTFDKEGDPISYELPGEIEQENSES